MRVYFFSSETYVYQGEGFLDKNDLAKVDGVTTIAPPPYNRNEVPFFDISTQHWRLMTLAKNDTAVPD